MSDKSDRSDQPDRPRDPYRLSAAAPEVAANTLICLINQTSFLLACQMQSLERSFLKDGGFTERLYQARSEARRRPPPPGPAGGRRQQSAAKPQILLDKLTLAGIS